jgi:hypothetical protein
MIILRHCWRTKCVRCDANRASDRAALPPRTGRWRRLGVRARPRPSYSAGHHRCGTAPGSHRLRYAQHPPRDLEPWDARSLSQPRGYYWRDSCDHQQDRVVAAGGEPGRPTHTREICRPGRLTRTRRPELGGTHTACVNLSIDCDCTARYPLVAIGEGNGDFSRPCLSDSRSMPACRCRICGGRRRTIVTGPSRYEMEGPKSRRHLPARRGRAGSAPPRPRPVAFGV